jgi:uncharacterized protein (TIGR03435 family)
MPNSRFLALAILAALLGGEAIRAQDFAFEVASIKPSQTVTPAMMQSGTLHLGMRVDASRVDIGNYSLGQLIGAAYEVKPYQISGPDWIVSGQRFDVVANLPAGSNKDQIPWMLQKLLAERFKLAVHDDSKELPVYQLVIGKKGLRLKESDSQEPDSSSSGPSVSGSSNAKVTQGRGGSTITYGGGVEQKMSMLPDGKSMRFELSRIDMARLAGWISPMLDKPVVDNTGLTAKYDLQLDLPLQDVLSGSRAVGWGGPADAPRSNATSASDPGGTIFSAFETLGLKFDTRKMAIKVVVVDHVERMPTPN